MMFYYVKCSLIVIITLALHNVKLKEVIDHLTFVLDYLLEQYDIKLQEQTVHCTCLVRLQLSHSISQIIISQHQLLYS